MFLFFAISFTNMKIQIKNSDGSVVFYRTSSPTPKVGYTIIDVTPEIQAVVDAGGPFRWVFETETQTRFGRTREVVVGGHLEKVEKTLEELKSDKVRELEQARYKNEIGGFTISGTGTALDGAFIRTDREVSQAKITQGAVAATINPAYTTDWKLSVGTIVTLDAASILLISTKFSEFEQAGRTKLKNLLQQVAAATTPAEIETINW